MTALTPLGLPNRPVAGRPAHLTRRAKAAIVVQFILNEGADVPLSDLPDEAQEALTMELGAMRYVDRTTLDAVIDEFTEELEAVGLSFPGDMAGALDRLEGRISAHTARRLRKEAGVRQRGDPWDRIGEQSVERLIEFVTSESIEIAAVLMSKINVTKAAQVLGRLPGPLARRITYAVSKTQRITPEAVDRIGLALASQIDAAPARAFTGAPEERIGAILNYSADRTREDVLEGLEQTDAPFAEAVRKAIFTFANIPERISAADLPRICRDVDNETLIIALAGSRTEELKIAADYILDSLSARMAGALREEIADRAAPKAKDVEAAHREVVDTIRGLVNSGEIKLVEPESEDA
ncbi:flagellar motor switch protein FliG [Roseivivax halodurans JCM 10272]|uniref:Flagellar motor switch protein FliG n=1 Tax=Roseivivax halodurans JCM 10272 TaxID=1449350 RepID=X7EFM9_9RHOB|nr:FliG C-terminal domain-containing protein [Roseivivax halodurans]ETX14695.1 flagellar motor switch protein FliG [Roseivivax halodurans JCM 10272]